MSEEQTILVVDDRDVDRRLLKKMLESRGYGVEEAANGREGLEMAELHKPDLIIADTLMPVMDGFGFLRGIRKNEKTKTIPFILYSAVYTGYEAEKLALSLGASTFIQKPIDTDEFLLKVEAVIKDAKAGKEIAIVDLHWEEEEYLRSYSHVVAAKLEKKVRELEATNGVLQMQIAKELRVEKSLRESEQNFRDMVENMLDGVAIADENAYHIYVNPKFSEITGYSRDELLNMTGWDFTRPEDRAKLKRRMKDRMAGKPVQTHYDRIIVRKDGTEVPVEMSTTVTVWQGKKRPMAIIHDIAERKRAEERIEHLNSVLKAIMNVNQLLVTEKDRGSLLKKACDVLIEARGYEAAWLGYLSDGETFDSVVGSGFREDVDRFCESVMGENRPLCIEKTLAGKGAIVIMDKSGECGDCPFKDAYAGRVTAVVRIEREGKLFGLLAISLAPDVTLDDEEEGILLEVASDIALGLHNMEMEESRKSAEDQIKAALKEKDVLLREIHHRVKNNLQVVSSLLDMQARGASNKDTIDMLTESKNRINAMALIHAQLYEGSDLSEINMKGFVNRLLVQLLQSYPVQDTKITPIVSVADYPFPISLAVPVGLILNELLSNALKHAFVGRKEGTIEVSLTASEEGEINLTVSDDGVGLPPGFDINATGTLGLRLVKILTEDQLRGSLEVISKEGAIFNMEFDTKY